MKKRTSKNQCAARGGRMSREQRREQITDSAVKLFAEFGFNGTTTKEIALGAGISEASLFQHFNTKAELYTAILEDKARRIYDDAWVNKINEYADANEDEKVFRQIAQKITEHCQHDRNFIRLMLYTALEKHENAQPFRRRMLYPAFEFLRDYIEKRKADGVFQQCSAEAAAFAFIGTQIYYAMGNVLFCSQMITINEEDAVSNLIKLSLDALRHNAPQAEKEIENFCHGKKSKDLQI